MSKFLGIAGSLVLCASMAAPLQAALIAPVGVTASSWANLSGIDQRVPEATIDGSGLTAGQHTVFPYDPTGPETMWMSNNEATPEITWDLGAVYLIDGFRLWNYNEATDPGRSVQFANVSTATSIGGPYTPLGLMNFLAAPLVSTYAGDDYTIPVTSARFIRFNVVDNYTTEENNTGLAEIRFNVVPEPTALAALGLASLTMLRRRQR